MTQMPPADNSDPYPSEPTFAAGNYGTPSARKLEFLDFWKQRNVGDSVWIDKYTANNLSIIIAYRSYLLNIGPNHLSCLSGSFSIFAFIFALLLPADNINFSVFIIYAMAQFSYLLDCADGQLARTSGQESDFGAFLDHGIDIVSAFFQFGALFCYLFRYFSAIGDVSLAELSLLIGFLFLSARSSRFFSMQYFIHMFSYMERKNRGQQSVVEHVLSSFMDHQMSLIGMFVFLISPLLGFAFFASQTVIITAIYLRYFYRAYGIDRE